MKCVKRKEGLAIDAIPVSRFVSNSSSPMMMVSHEAELHEAKDPIYFYFISEFPPKLNLRGEDFDKRLFRSEVI
jgi:hypothetical protein